MFAINFAIRALQRARKLVTKREAKLRDAATAERNLQDALLKEIPESVIRAHLGQSAS